MSKKNQQQLPVSFAKHSAKVLFTRPSSLRSRCFSAAVQTWRLIDGQAARRGIHVAAPVMLHSLSRTGSRLVVFCFFLWQRKSVISETCNRCATELSASLSRFPQSLKLVST